MLEKSLLISSMRSFSSRISRSLDSHSSFLWFLTSSRRYCESALRASSSSFWVYCWSILEWSSRSMLRYCVVIWCTICLVSEALFSNESFLLSAQSCNSSVFAWLMFCRSYSLTIRYLSCSTYAVKSWCISAWSVPSSSPEAPFLSPFFFGAITVNLL